MAKRDAKIELIRTSIAHEIDLINAGVKRVGRPLPSADNKPAVVGGLRRALEILDKVNDETA